MYLSRPVSKATDVMHVSGRYAYIEGTKPAPKSFLKTLARMVVEADKLPPEAFLGMPLFDVVGEGGGVG